MPSACEPPTCPKTSVTLLVVIYVQCTCNVHICTCVQSPVNQVQPTCNRHMRTLHQHLCAPSTHIHMDTPAVLTWCFHCKHSYKQTFTNEQPGNEAVNVESVVISNGINRSVQGS